MMSSSNDNNNDNNNNIKHLVILTLKQHEDGIWIRQLVRALNEVSTTSQKNSSASIQVQVQVHALEEWLAQGWMVSDDCFQNIVGIVNRVSDAAPPALFKACCAILVAAQALQIPIVNGPTSYALCANKWCQHVLFRQAKLDAPKTMAYWNTGSSTTTSDDQQQSSAAAAAASNHRQFLPETHGTYSSHLLIKPNAGGFGAGIARVASVPETLPTFQDGITLIQQYIPPRNRKVYRIWFLRGKVQCAVERSIIPDDDNDNDNESSEFTGACASGTTSCSIRPPPLVEAWKVPTDVREEIEGQLLPLLKDAHCGSVEFLYSSYEEKESGEEERRLYFDLNLLSTLPVQTNTVSDPNQIWAKDYDPWKELAAAVWETIEPS
jgi:hypothetical protein